MAMEVNRYHKELRECLKPWWEYPKPEPPPKLIIFVAPTGISIRREQNPAQPYAPEEIAEETYRAYKAGAVGVHIHARRDDGTATSDPELFGKIIDLVRQRCPDIIIECSCLTGETLEATLKPFEDKRVEMTALELGSFNSREHVYIISNTEIMARGEYFKEQGIKPWLVVMQSGWPKQAKDLLIEPGLVDKPYLWEPCFGMQDCTPFSVANYVHLRQTLPPDSLAMALGCGRCALDVTVTGIVLGDHVRVGMEDALYRVGHKDVKVKSNEELVKRAVEVANILEREIATPDEARRMLGIKPRR